MDIPSPARFFSITISVSSPGTTGHDISSLSSFFARTATGLDFLAGSEVETDGAGKEAFRGGSSGGEGAAGGQKEASNTKT